MKRRDFFTRMALGTAAVAVAPRILAQEPIKALDPYRNVVNNPYYKWVKAKRSSVHTKDNNYWKCLSGTTVSRDDKITALNLRGHKWENGNGYYWIDHSLIRMNHAIHFREYDWVYQVRYDREYDWCRDQLTHFWMNIEDYSFYESLNERRVFDPHHNHLLGVGLVPGLIDPLNPRGAYSQSPYRLKNNISTVRTVYPVDSYEIHILYQKIK